MDVKIMYYILPLLFCAFGLALSQLVNVAVDRPVSQSFTYLDWAGDKAVDGNTCRDEGQYPDDDKCCSATKVGSGDEVFWMIDLEEQYEVTRLEIFARNDPVGGNTNQLDGFQLFVTKKDNVPGELVNVTDNITEHTNIYQKEFSTKTLIRHIVVQRPGATILTICEFRAFAVCNDGSYGGDCRFKCGHCEGPVPCNKTTGLCPSGECEPGWWGDRCFNQCGNCSGSTQCNSTTGHCGAGCNPGWKGSLCNITCDIGEWGLNCGDNCSNCFGDTICNIVNGHCPSGCDTGWTQPKCDTECTKSWGMNCSNPCGSCADGTICHHVNGSCFGRCSPGWRGELCDKACENRTWGDGCNTSCGNCFSDTVCDHVTGACSSGCMAGWERNQCIEACSGSWGLDCGKSCGACSDNVDCHPINGSCFGGCKPGWLGEVCLEACSNDTWGVQCENSCGNCHGNTTCHNEHGECLAGCNEGWTGRRCLEAYIPKKTNGSTSSSSLIGGTVGGVVVAIVVICALIVWRRHRHRSRRANENSFENYVNPIMPVETSTIDDHVQPASQNKSLYKNVKKNGSSTVIRVADFREFCRNNCVKNSLLFEQFENLPYGLQYETTAATSGPNKKKNRYKDMFAYDKNRVTLPICDGEHTSDYVNASFIKGYTADVVYLAAQGVMQCTLNDFWWMIWTQNVSNIVMLTQCYESGRMKSVQYWPDGDEGNYGDLCVSIKKEDIFADFTIRHMICTYKTTSAQRSITQFHFTAWPDKDIPDHPLSLVQFWRKVKDSSEADKIPWLVHCSAGVGRTGTFIALDYLYQQAKAEQVVDVNGCVRILREQRVNMVQTATQYMYLHQAALEAVQPIGSICKPDRLRELYADLKLSGAGSLTKLESEFQSIQHDAEATVTNDILQGTNANDIYHNVSVEKYADSNLSDNTSKTRDRNVLPDDVYRPRLLDVVGCQSDYINAVSLQVLLNGLLEIKQHEKGQEKTYLRTTGIIITQTPLPDTLVDFLRMVWDNHVIVVIMMDDGQAINNVGTYWESKRAGQFAVEVRSVHTLNYVTIREMSVSLLGECRTLKQFQYKDWPEDRKVPQKISSVIELHEMVYKNCDAHAPVIVHCLNGADRSGLFCVLWTILERLRAEGKVAIAETVRSMKIRRPQIIPNVEQYQFCYAMLLEHVQSYELYASVL